MLGRPTLGTVGYLVFGRSPFRMMAILILLFIFTVFIIRESRQTLTLPFRMPGTFPPPVIVLATADKTYMTAFDACGIEVATVHVEMPPIRRENDKPTSWNPAIEDLGQVLKQMRKPFHEQTDIHLNLKHNHSMEPEEKMKIIQESIKENQKHAEDINAKLANIDADAIFADDYSDDDTTESDVTGSDVVDDKTDKGAEVISRSDIEEEVLDEENAFKWNLRNDHRRNVHVYLWTSTVFKGDKWTHFVEKLPGVRLNRMTPSQVMKNTLLSDWSFKNGLNTRTTWISWFTAALGFLWKNGGLLLPMGVIMTKPLGVASVGYGAGAIGGHADQVSVSPMIFGTTPRHDIVKEAMQMMKNEDDYLKYTVPEYTGNAHTMEQILEPLVPILSEAVKEGCGATKIPYLYVSDCGDYSLIPSEEIVSLDVTKSLGPGLPERKTLLHYGGSPHDLDDPMLVKELFQNLRLKHYCPNVAREVMKSAPKTGL